MTDSQEANPQEANPQETDPQSSMPATASIAQAETTSPEMETAAGLPLRPATEEPVPSYVKLAMRNMVKKGGTSLFHFTLTTMALLGVLVGLAYITR